MQAWWRVLRGAWPYRWVVVVSMICALGVGMSYAAGVGVMLPVMKIFTSVEGVHGWANRVASEKRLDVAIMDLDQTVKRVEGNKGDGLRIVEARANADLRLKPVGDALPRITSVRSGDAPLADTWQKMVAVISHAPDGSALQLDVVGLGTFDVTARKLPWYTRYFLWAVDLLSIDNPTLALIQVMCFFIFLCFVGSIFRYYQQFLGMTVANRVVMDIRRRMYDRVVQLPTSYFAQKGTSDIMSRLTQDTNTLTDGVSMALGKAIQEPVKAFFSFGLALWIDWRLCLMVVISMPVLGLIIRKFSKRMRRASRRALESWSGMLSIINETLIGARVVKAYTAEGYERRRFAWINKKLLKEQIKINHYSALSRPTIETLAVIFSSIPMIFAAHWVLRGNAEKENFFTLLACLVAMLEPMRKLADVNSKVQQTNAAATRVFEIVDMDPEPNYKNDLPKLPLHRRTIEFRDITFNYPGHEEIVIKNLSVTVRHGQTVAVVGGNGSGKTTLLNLVPRLYIPTSGQVLIDGVDTATVSLRSLRKQIGLVTQDTLLFADTIYNNIAYGARHTTRELVMEASRRSYADEFIRELPLGYDTLVGEHGVRLSGGQKQRIAIARAILRQPSILILDEAMSQIDSDSEMKITTALQAFTKDRTTFVIAHRFATVVNADMIVCLDAGKVCGIGNHQQLMDACPQYRKLYENQFREVG